MRVRVLYFAAVRERVGLEEEALDLPAAVRTVGEFARWIEERTPALAGVMGSVRVARNEAFAASGDVLEEGDVLALLPPVAGG